jgi:hypothetical protein
VLLGSVRQALFDAFFFFAALGMQDRDCRSFVSPCWPGDYILYQVRMIDALRKREGRRSACA